MVSDNGQEEGEIKVKFCPLLDKYCIMDRCAIHAEMTRNMGGLQQKFGMCAFNAVVTLLSEMNLKAQPPQQKLQMPHILRG